MDKKNENPPKQPDRKTEEDFRGYAGSEERQKIITTPTEEDKLVSDVREKKEENPNTPNQSLRDEIESDGSGNAFEGTEDATRE